MTRIASVVLQNKVKFLT